MLQVHGGEGQLRFKSRSSVSKLCFMYLPGWCYTQPCAGEAQRWSYIFGERSKVNSSWFHNVGWVYHQLLEACFSIMVIQQPLFARPMFLAFSHEAALLQNFLCFRYTHLPPTYPHTHDHPRSGGGEEGLLPLRASKGSSNHRSESLRAYTSYFPVLEDQTPTSWHSPLLLDGGGDGGIWALLHMDLRVLYYDVNHRRFCREGIKNSPTALPLPPNTHIHTHVRPYSRPGIGSATKMFHPGSHLWQGRMWCPYRDMGTAHHVPFKAKDFSPLSKSVSQSKCLLNFKLNGHLKADCSTPTVKEMKLLALLVLSLGSRFEGWMEFCPVLANIWRTAQSAFRGKNTPLSYCMPSAWVLSTQGYRPFFSEHEGQPSFFLWTRRARCSVIRKQMMELQLSVIGGSAFHVCPASSFWKPCILSLDHTTHLRSKAEPDFYHHDVDEE